MFSLVQQFYRTATLLARANCNTPHLRRAYPFIDSRPKKVATNQATLLRQWHMLRLIPRAPGKITVQDIHSRLASEDFDVTIRTIQRDLHELSQTFPLTVDE